ncbi:M64 family metallopeptidase [Thioclava indica]|uniref:VWFA domain-containing protein n=1 Tax=Thioclava indica TaxID=1353528 RepID=A0A074KJ38_9RHOB|nr:M64 family metallopeptidase [Thioclava indica]KEO61562.1 hypothetical protein DT23_00925 [Thioclava indica]
MGVNDGAVIGLSKVVDHGPATERWNIVLVAEGFQAAEMPKFHNEVSKFIDKLFNTVPFGDMWCGINIYQLDVSSTDSGADEPGGGECTGANVFRDTYFDATFCSGGTQRALTVDSSLVLQEVIDLLPEYEEAIVIVNSDVYGGTGGAVGTYSLGFSPITGKGGVEIAIHELGHAGFQLADEYDYDSVGTYGGSEPARVNITANADKNTIKWGDLIAGPTAVPTQTNGNCNEPNEDPSPVADGTVGAFEGAGYWPCGLYRPEYTCMMRELAQPFCAVCERRIREVLQTYIAPVTVTLATPSVDFHDIPEGIGGAGVTTYRAIIFDVGSCAPLQLQVISGPTGGFGLPLGGNVIVSPGQAMTQGKIWISYTSTTAGASASGTVTIEAVETGETFVVTITANTVARPTAAAALVLDRSGSMNEDAGDGTAKISKLRQAVKTFVDVMLPGDGVGLVRFSNDADIVEPVGDVAVIGGTVKTAVDSADFNLGGNTSVGDGLVAGTDALNAAGSYDTKAMVVLTDGKENRAEYIEDVAGLITANTFGIGFGTPANVDVGKLEILTGTHSGYLLITGAITPSEQFRLQKYFLQILAGITNSEVIVDPTGTLTRKDPLQIPFSVTEADYGIDVILLAKEPRAVDFRLETPSGAIIDANVAIIEPNVDLIRTPNVAYYRIGLPVGVEGGHAGQWKAHLRLMGAVQDDAVAAQSYLRQMPFSLLVHAYSTLSFRAHLTQSGPEPGATLTLSAVLTEYARPLSDGVSVWAEMTRPDGTAISIPLIANEPGRFVTTISEFAAGLYRFRIRAFGMTSSERAFTREQTLTAVIGSTKPGDGNPRPDYCDLLDCIVQTQRDPKDATTSSSGAINVDWNSLARCLRKICQPRRSDG